MSKFRVFMILLNLAAFGLGLYFLYQENIGFRFDRWIDIPIIAILLGIPTLNLIYVALAAPRKEDSLFALRVQSKKERTEGPKDI